MKDIILNLANINLINFCIENNIDCSNTHIVKNGRGYNYSLVRNGVSIVTVMFSKNSVPKHLIH